jgi:hypothetical protein
LLVGSTKGGGMRGLKKLERPQQRADGAALVDELINMSFLISPGTT